MDVLSRFALDDKVAIVTGASSGLGVSAAAGLAAAGADLVLVARRAEKLADTQRQVEALGRRCVVVPGDVADPATAERAVGTATETFGKVDVLLNNAGIGTAVPATRETPEQFRQVTDINLHGSYWMAQACGRVMQPGASIINVGSVLGFTTAGLPQAAYASSKAAIIGLTRDLAAQWTGRKGIRVNAIAPGFFASEMTDQYPDGYLEQMIGRVPAGRKGEPEEFVAAVVFLASDASSYVTGITLPVDGGLLTN
ncbi:SDR family NAD(P)-dependent oxidoreductase [Egicoccus halophilus]|uniref:2-deoxy-D-gluconate 3-dehydrogenase n=1 Tax=Egicoccus halophilus TaxID=1670830 RepID=A0A8J3EUE5_9ACTN|nr:SDR family oxidoreductase [Egicoccus halophilus]GGI07029.1 2-deoxy-D-gluconate 3-dehydrogenase [Egicoccus halophilus]